MTEDKEQFGRKFIIFPNPTDGHWLKAIFGDSEPPATPENRAKFKATVNSIAWPLKHWQGCVAAGYPQRLTPTHGRETGYEADCCANTL
ncbi:hypothetical protein D3C75_1252410 [compost metagenome]